MEDHAALPADPMQKDPPVKPDGPPPGKGKQHPKRAHTNEGPGCSHEGFWRAVRAALQSAADANESSAETIPFQQRFQNVCSTCLERWNIARRCREQQRFDRFDRQGFTLVTAPSKPVAQQRGAKSLKAAAASPWDDPAENAEGLVPALPSLVQFDMHRNQRRNSGADIDSAKPFRCSRRERCRARSRIRELFGIGFGFGFAGGVRICGSEIWFTGNRTGNRRTGNRLRGPESFHEQESRRARRFRTRQAWPYGCGIRLAHLAPFEFHFSIGVQSRGAMDFLGCSDVCEAMNSSAVRFSHFVRAFCGDRTLRE